MKKTLLFGALIVAAYGNAQMTQANEPSISDVQSMHLVDSFVVNLEGVTGAGVTWDYTNLAGYENEQRDIEVVTPASTTYGSNFTAASMAIKMGNNITSYFSSTSSEKISHGFTFVEPTFGDINVILDTDPEIVATYPFGYGSTSTDTYSGTISNTTIGTPATTGVAHSSIDGEGTLNLPNSVSVPNVIRFKMVDTSLATLPVFGDLKVIRTQFEYYDYANSNLPIFIHSKITVFQGASTTPTTVIPLVLSFYPTTEYVGTKELNEIAYSVYPNPANEKVTINGDFSSDAIVTLLDQSGRVLTTANAQSGTQLDISSFENGVYFIRIEDNGSVGTQSIIKQ